MRARCCLTGPELTGEDRTAEGQRRYLRVVDFAGLPADGVRSSLLVEGHEGSVRVSRASVPPGTPPRELHFHEIDQLYYVLSGTMDLEIDGHSYRAGPGTLVVIPARTPHRNWNRGGESAVHLSLMPGIRDGSPRTFRLGEADRALSRGSVR